MFAIIKQVLVFQIALYGIPACDFEAMKLQRIGNTYFCKLQIVLIMALLVAVIATPSSKRLALWSGSY